MKRVVMVLCVGVCLMAVQAMPTADEIAKVTPVVQELTKGDYAALKAGRKSPEQVAETLLGYVKDAESEAAKYVLMRKAFDLYLEHGPLPKARDVANTLMPVHVKGCNLNGFNERLGCALAAKDLWNDAFMAFERCGGKMAEVVAWEKAYPETGITELTAGSVGEFWWELSEKYADSPKVATALRAHAVCWLKEALKNNSLRGLKRTLAAKRIAEVEKGSRSVPSSAPVPSSLEPRDDAPRVTDARPSAADQQGKRGRELETAEDFARASAVKITKPAGKPIILNLGKGAKIEFIGCPAGVFMMGTDRKNAQHPYAFYHKVKITRPFWLSKYLVTHEEWNAYQKVKLTKEDKVLGGMKRTHCVAREEMDAFCEWLMKCYGRGLPAGYVFRAPTEAEWELAFRTDLVNRADPYVEIRRHNRDLPKESLSYTVVFDDDVFPKLQKAGLAEPRGANRFEGYILGCEVGTKKPNPWGFYDMIGIRGELMLDTVDSDKWPHQKKSDKVVQTAFRYDDEETDPLHYFSDVPRRAEPLIRGGRNINWFYYRAYKTTPWYFLKGKIGTVHYNLYLHPFRVCIGPDLIKEKGFKKLKSSGRK